MCGAYGCRGVRRGNRLQVSEGLRFTRNNGPDVSVSLGINYWGSINALYFQSLQPDVR